ncbi:MAG: hypothetical protein GY936_19580 [Ignavibacteriae bacterium]|nr:hypothetical protein [Ignavibacteriota bacterium]
MKLDWLIYSLRYFWELPQNLSGLVVYLLNKKKIISVRKINGRLLFKNPNFGVSLGNYIFWTLSINDRNADIPINLKHEFGHSVQSQLFGPLYLIVVGIPSISRVFYSRIFYSVKKQEWTNYYKGFPEKWADSLGLKHYKV